MACSVPRCRILVFLGGSRAYWESRPRLLSNERNMYRAPLLDTGGDFWGRSLTTHQFFWASDGESYVLLVFIAHISTISDSGYAVTTEIADRHSCVCPDRWCDGRDIGLAMISFGNTEFRAPFTHAAGDCEKWPYADRP